MRIIVDTSVWSLALRRRRKDLSARERAMVLELPDLIIKGDVVMLGAVRQELLTGIVDRKSFETLRQCIAGFDDIVPQHDDYERAAEYANECSRAGIAATTIDMLICAIAGAHGLRILTTDADFIRYARTLPIDLYDNF